MIYLDYNATTPLHPEVIEIMMQTIKKNFGNPSSSHRLGLDAKRVIENARANLAALINCDSDEVFFTSCGTESNNYALKGIANKLKKKGNHIITSSIEHPSIIEVARYLENEDFEVTYLPVNSKGYVEINQLAGSIKKNTILISVMLANNETGVIQPISEFARIAQKRGIIFHTDAAQATGKIKVDVRQLDVDLLTIAGHKFYAPKGVGALYIRRGVDLEKILHGASHESNHRAGTENVIHIAGLGKACEMAMANLDTYSNHCSLLRDKLYQGLKSAGLTFRLNSDLEKGLPNTLNVSFKGVEANTLLSEVENRIALSAGAACHEDTVDVSPVIEAMKVPLDYAMGTIRFSTGVYTSEKDITEALEILTDKIASYKVSAEKLPEQHDSHENIKLTHFTHGLGCACKIKPQILKGILDKISVITNENILVGTESSDDAAVYKISSDTAIVVTTDFFTPIVDDPSSFGEIAAANALSDVYAMGAEPLFALNIVGFPVNRLPLGVLEDILKGAQQKAHEAGIPILGGHTIDDVEPKYGMVVVGKVHPAKIWSNCTVKENDLLVLTKPLGMGILTTALKKGLISRESSERITLLMASLNKTASEILKEYKVNACTDVTGFGLIGHLKEMLSQGKHSAEIRFSSIPVLNEVWDILAMKLIPGGTLSNYQYAGDFVSWSGSLSYAKKIALCDAQTSGGLLASVPCSDQVSGLLEEMKAAGITASVIGKITELKNKKIVVLD